jgi:heme exporter protein C
MYDLDSKMRMVFYPAVLGWILLGFWLTSLRIRTRNIEEKIIDFENE